MYAKSRQWEIFFLTLAATAFFMSLWHVSSTRAESDYCTTNICHDIFTYWDCSEKDGITASLSRCSLCTSGGRCNSLGDGACSPGDTPYSIWVSDVNLICDCYLQGVGTYDLVEATLVNKTGNELETGVNNDICVTSTGS